MPDYPTYRDNLRHVVRPEVPEDRRRADSIGLDAPTAMHLREILDEWADYQADSGSEADVAKAYVEYLDMVVRDEARGYVEVYAHTDLAVDVLDAATVWAEPDGPTTVRASALAEMSLREHAASDVRHAVQTEFDV